MGRFLCFLFCVTLRLMVSAELGKVGVCIVGTEPQQMMRCMESAYEYLSPRESIHYFIFIPAQHIPNKVYEDEYVSMIPAESGFTVDWFLPLYTPVILSCYAALFADYDTLVVIDSNCLFVQDVSLENLQPSFTVARERDTQLPYSYMFWGGPKAYILDICQWVANEIYQNLSHRALASQNFANKVFNEYWQKHPPQQILPHTFMVCHRKRYLLWEQSPQENTDVHIIDRGAL